MKRHVSALTVFNLAPVGCGLDTSIANGVKEKPKKTPKFQTRCFRRCAETFSSHNHFTSKNNYATTTCKRTLNKKSIQRGYFIHIYDIY